MSKAKMLAGGAMIVAALLAATPAAAAVANTNVNVRATPGGTIVDVLRRGESATIVGRTGGWCAIRHDGPRGYVACRYLSDDGFNDDFVVRSPSRPDVDVSVSFSVPGFSISIGDGDFNRPNRPNRPGQRDRVCFYEHVNYDGDSFCVRPGERLRALGSWNDRISSIRVRGDAEALVCEHNGFRGRCVVIDDSVRSLGRRGNDIISSIRVR